LYHSASGSDSKHALVTYLSNSNVHCSYRLKSYYVLLQLDDLSHQVGTDEPSDESATNNDNNCHDNNAESKDIDLKVTCLHYPLVLKTSCCSADDWDKIWHQSEDVNI
jgi:hypothetical protein